MSEHVAGLSYGGGEGLEELKAQVEPSFMNLYFVLLVNACVCQKAKLNTKNEIKRPLSNSRWLSLLVFNSVTHVG